VARAESDLNRFLNEVEDCIQEAQMAVLERDKMAWLLLAEDWMKLARAARERDI